MTVDLYECERCRLQWVPTGDDRLCPRCGRYSTLPQRVVVCGREVQVAAVLKFGAADGLGNPAVREAVQNLDLSICPHGFIAAWICPQC